MYHPFFQFVLPRLGQVALDALLYLNFLQLPPLQLVARWPVLYYGLPLVLMGVLAYISRDPLGLGIVFAGHLVTFYCIGTAIGLALRRIGGTPLTVWRIIWLDGITPWLLTGLIMWWGRRRALRLCTTKYSLTTRKNLPNGRKSLPSRAGTSAPMSKSRARRARIRSASRRAKSRRETSSLPNVQMAIRTRPSARAAAAIAETETRTAIRSRQSRVNEHNERTFPQGKALFVQVL